VVCPVIPVKWQTLRNREYASSFVLTLRKQVLRPMSCSKRFRDNTMCKTETSKRYSGFKSGKTSVQDLEHLGYHHQDQPIKQKKCVKASMRKDTA